MTTLEMTYTAYELENAFELYDVRQINDLTDATDYKPSRSYHNGRIYGSGRYGNPEKEARYQMWLNDYDLVQSSLDEYYYYLHNYGSILTIDQNGNIETDFDSGLSEDPAPKIVLRILVRPTEIEEGEIVEENDIYPNDLLNEEPFIRAPLISAEAAKIMADEFTFKLCFNDDDDYDESESPISAAEAEMIEIIRTYQEII